MQLCRSHMYHFFMRQLPEKTHHKPLDHDKTGLFGDVGEFIVAANLSRGAQVHFSSLIHVQSHLGPGCETQKSTRINTFLQILRTNMDNSQLTALSVFVFRSTANPGPESISDMYCVWQAGPCSPSNLETVSYVNRRQKKRPLVHTTEFLPILPDCNHILAEKSVPRE